MQIAFFVPGERPSVRCVVVLCVVTALLAAGPVKAQFSDGFATTGNQAAAMELRLSRVERQLQELTGRYEETEFALRRLTQRLDRLVNDLEMRLGEVESGQPTTTTFAPSRPPPASAPPPPSREPPRTAAMDLDLGPPAGGPPPGTSYPPRASQALSGPSLPGGSAPEDYDYAFGFLRREEYEQAQQALQAFLGKYPDHVLASNAQYWLAETLYARGLFAEAAVAFAEGIQRFPDGSKAPDNLLKLGMSLSQLNQNQDACVAFGQLEAQYPNAPSSLKRRAQQERQRLRCS